MQGGRALSAVSLAVAAMACGTTRSKVREARNAMYDAPFATVWNAVTEEVHQRFPSIQTEDPVSGTIVTNYVTVARGDSQSSAATGGGGSPVLGTTTTSSAVGQQQLGQTELDLFRAIVQVKGGPKKGEGPWRVVVDGTAAQYSPGMADSGIVPIKHGAADEPPWVEERINTLEVGIHKRLSPHALKKVPVASVATKTFDTDTSPWANLPDRAATTLIGKVHRAAIQRDTTALRPTMVDDFRWGLGADGSAETALALWSADPSKLRELAKTLEVGCAPEQVTGEVVCPANPAARSMARFRKVGGDWKFVLFLVR